MTQAIRRRDPRAVPRETIVDAVVDRLRHLILSGEMADGSPMRQDALAAEMGTSRIPVREALSRLESEGLVASFPHRGYVVTGLSRSEIDEVFDLRMLLEPELIRHAIPRMTERHLESAQAILDEFERSLGSGDVHRWGELNRLFHLALYAPSGRTRSLEIVRALLVNADRYTRVVLSVEASIAAASEDHQGMYDLCRRGLVNQAVALTRDHIERTAVDLRSMLDREERLAVPPAAEKS